jgi:acyl-CoA dehydrogenase
MLDGLEVMERKRAHRLLFQRLAGLAPAEELQELEAEVEQHLKLAETEKEAQVEPLFRRLAAFTAQALARESR